MKTAKDRFLEKVKIAENSCHEWQSTMHRDGYGKFWYNGKTLAAHRVAWLLFKGEIPADKWVLHKCDNRRCVNVDHLYIGTPSDNVRDKVDRCEWWGNMRHSQDIIDEAIRLYRETPMTQQAVADHLGISQIMVSRYSRGAYARQRRGRNETT